MPHIPMELSYQIGAMLKSLANVEDFINGMRDVEDVDPGGIVVAQLDLCPACLGEGFYVDDLQREIYCFTCVSSGFVPLETRAK